MTPAAKQKAPRSRQARGAGRVRTESRGTSETTSPRRGRPAVAGAPRSERVTIRVTPSRLYEWIEHARARGMPLADWAREVIDAAIAAPPGGE